MLTANEIKTRGVKAIADALEKRDRVPITVRGKVKYASVEEHLAQIDVELKEDTNA